jgi:hypothetical protein
MIGNYLKMNSGIKDGEHTAVEGRSLPEERRLWPRLWALGIDGVPADFADPQTHPHDQASASHPEMSQPKRVFIPLRLCVLSYSLYPDR